MHGLTEGTAVTCRVKNNYRKEDFKGMRIMAKKQLLRSMNLVFIIIFTADSL